MWLLPHEVRIQSRVSSTAVAITHGNHACTMQGQNSRFPVGLPGPITCTDRPRPGLPTLYVREACRRPNHFPRFQHLLRVLFYHRMYECLPLVITHYPI